MFRKLCSFLETLYVELKPGLGCLRESPRVERYTCYTNTNAIAVHALRLYGSPLVDNVMGFLSLYGYTCSGRFEVLWLKPIPYPPQSTKTVVLGEVRVGGNVFKVKADTPTGRVLPDWTRYADLLVLAVLEKLGRVELEAAHRLHETVLHMWDGRGLADKVYGVTRLYEAYKLSLYAFLARALEAENHVASTVPAILEKLVAPESGIATHYTPGLKPVGDPNLETTSLTILALYSSYPEKLHQHAALVHLQRLVARLTITAAPLTLIAWILAHLARRRRRAT